MADKPKRHRGKRRWLPSADPEATVQALISLNPEQGPELSDDDIRTVVRRAEADPEADEDRLE
jgi:hypothetical protein